MLEGSIGIRVAMEDLCEACRISSWLETEKYHPQFQWLAFRFFRDGFRAGAGDGSMFNFFERGIISEQEPTQSVYFHRAHCRSLAKILNRCGDSHAVIRASTTGPYQLVVILDGVVVYLHGHDGPPQWPDEQKLLSTPPAWTCTFCPAEWEGPWGSLLAVARPAFHDAILPLVTMTPAADGKTIIAVAEYQGKKTCRKLPVTSMDSTNTTCGHITVPIGNFSSILKECRHKTAQIEAIGVNGVVRICPEVGSSSKWRRVMLIARIIPRNTTKEPVAKLASNSNGTAPVTT
jgi:hypothetical protein